MKVRLVALPLLAQAVPLHAGVRLRVVACRVDGVEPATYARRGGWRRTWRDDPSRRLYVAGLRQERLERAAAAVVFALDVERLAAELGARGLRVALLYAGMAGELVYLAAQRRGLGVHGVGGVADAALRELMGPAGGDLVPVYMWRWARAADPRSGAPPARPGGGLAAPPRTTAGCAPTTAAGGA